MKLYQRGGQGNVELVSKDKPKEGEKKEERGSLTDRLKAKFLKRKS